MKTLTLTVKYHPDECHDCKITEGKGYRITDKTTYLGLFSITRRYTLCKRCLTKICASFPCQDDASNYK